MSNVSKGHHATERSFKHGGGIAWPRKCRECGEIPPGRRGMCYGFCERCYKRWLYHWDPAWRKKELERCKKVRQKAKGKTASRPTRKLVASPSPAKARRPGKEADLLPPSLPRPSGCRHIWIDEARDYLCKHTWMIRRHKSKYFECMECEYKEMVK